MQPGPTPIMPGLTRVLAPNPGPLTLDGTNTWIIHDGPHALVIDPGPALPAHRDTVLEVTSQVTGEARVLLTHSHADHSELVPELTARGLRRLVLADAEPFEVGRFLLTAIATPGHTADSMSYLLITPDSSRWLFSGDTILGRGSSVVAHPDGSLGPYLDSLRTLREVMADGGVVLPGHGPVVQDSGAIIQDYLKHRLYRLEQVRAALDDGAATIREIVEKVYAGVDIALLPAAEQSVAAQLEHLAQVSGTAVPAAPGPG